MVLQTTPLPLGYGAGTNSTGTSYKRMPETRIFVKAAIYNNT